MDGEQKRKVLEAYRGWAESYDRLMRRGYQRVERAISDEHLLSHLPARSDGRLLDAGGGDGIRAVDLLRADRAGAAVVLDLSGDMLRLAARRAACSEARLTLVRGDVSDLPFPDGTFDLTVSFGGVVSHCPDHERAIAELCRVTRPGGHLAVSVDARAVGVRTASRARSPELLRAVLGPGTAPVFHFHPYPFDVHFFTSEELVRILEAHEVEVLSVIGKPVFTQFLQPQELLSEPEVRQRVEMAMPFAEDPEFLPYADQLEAVGRI